jgi:hypothetical protein
MKKMLLSASVIAAVLLMAGCGTPLPPGTEQGPHGTIAYLVSIDASPPGARIEANGDAVGNTPVTIKVFANRDGTFHNFGADYYVIRAFPLVTNQYVQTRWFGTGRSGTQKSQVPGKVYFDMNQPQPPPPPAAVSGQSAPPPNYYPPPPYWYYPPPPIFFGPPVGFRGGFYHHH